jgi:hypothetical protein
MRTKRGSVLGGFGFELDFEGASTGGTLGGADDFRRTFLAGRPDEGGGPFMSSLPSS